MNLYEIQKQHKDIINQIEKNEGEITPELNELLEINEYELKEKSMSYLHVISSNDATIIQIDAEIKRLQAIKRQKSNLISRLKDHLLDAVKQFGAFEVNFNRFSTRKSTLVDVKIDKINQLSKEFKTIKVTEQPNKRAIKEALKNGVKIEGCELLERKTLKIN